MRFPAPKTALRLIVPLLIAAAIGWYFFFPSAQAVKYVTAPVTQGSIVRAVTATGTVNPVITVQVGTYVSGPITNIYVDFNSSVKAGQLMAKIDPRPFAAAVAQSSAAVANAKAQLAKDQANLAYQEVTYRRDVQLRKDDVVSQDQLDSQLNTYDQAKAQVGLDQAAIQQQEANLQTAKLNLNYTDIISPVDGTVVSRNVDVGQTVAASFQTPTLFLVAKDLTKMQVDCNVSESDIGDVRNGVHAEFTVDAFGERTFDGIVTQVRQAPITVQNVVTYDVVITVDNPELLLKPGMTANATLITARRDQVIRIPLEAVRFSPKRNGGGNAATDGAAPRRNNRVFVLDNGKLKRVKITTGLDDGANIEMLSGPLQPGDLVVTDEIRQVSKAASSSSMPRFPH
jgi:HlyD family secretion protein